MYNPQDLMSIAIECRRLFDDCARVSPDLFGCTVLDLCADRIPDVPLDTLKDAIVVSGIAGICNDRIKRQIAKYAHTGTR